MAQDSRTIRDLMTRNPECVTEKDTIHDAARIMKSKGTGIVPVVDDNRKVTGLITDRDIVVRGIAEGKNVAGLRVSELMTRQVRSVREDSNVDEAMNLMGSADIRRLPVVNQNDEIVGIISIGDISTKTDKQGKVGRTIEEISEARPNN
jgi:CBS domain-containing protein